MICIDWGYAYIAGNMNATTAVSLGDYNEMKSTFASSGKLLPSKGEIVTRQAKLMPARHTPTTWEWYLQPESPDS